MNRGLVEHSAFRKWRCYRRAAAQLACSWSNARENRKGAFYESTGFPFFRIENEDEKDSSRPGY